MYYLVIHHPGSTYVQLITGQGCLFMGTKKWLSFHKPHQLSARYSNPVDTKYTSSVQKLHSVFQHFDLIKATYVLDKHILTFQLLQYILNTFTSSTAQELLSNATRLRALNATLHEHLPGASIITPGHNKPDRDGAILPRPSIYTHQLYELFSGLPATQNQQSQLQDPATFRRSKQEQPPSYRRMSS